MRGLLEAGGLSPHDTILALSTIAFIEADLISNLSTGPIQIGVVAPERTFALRHQVLRPHERLLDMSLPGSGHPDSAAIAAVTVTGDEVVGTATVSPEDPPVALAPVLPPGTTWRLRSMATRPDLRGTGVGSAVLAFAVQHVAAHGGGVLWCNARTPAQRFYERAGFTAFGEPWVDEAIGPHVMMWRSVPAAGERRPVDESQADE